MFPEMPKVLIVSVRFPPYNNMASIRLGKLAKYLNEFGWEPWVLTVEKDLIESVGNLPVEIDENHVIRAGYCWPLCWLVGYNRRTNNAESEFKRDEEAGERVGEPPIKSRKPFYRWLVGHLRHTRWPDQGMPWRRRAITRGRILLKEHNFDIIFSSHGPPSSHVVASALARHFRLPWVADFRDLWSLNHIVRRKGLAQMVEAWFERRVLRFADALTTVSEPLAGQLQGLHEKPTTVIMNGFDEEDYRHLKDRPDKRLFVISYTGMIYEGKQDPRILFEAVRSFNETRDGTEFPIEVRFYGTKPAHLERIIDDYGVSEWVKIFPRVSYQEATRVQVEADALLLLEWNDPSAAGVYTGKVFEYIGARKPILAVGPEGGVIEELLLKTKSGCLAKNCGAALTALREWVQMKKSIGTTRLKTDPKLIRPYTRRHQAGILAGLLDRALGR